MVKVVAAGATRDVGREVVAQIAASKRHHVTVLTRSEPTSASTSTEDNDGTIAWVKVDYSDRDALAAIMKGADAVLSFITPGSDPGNASQKNLIDAAVDAKVRRFAPSEWACVSNSGMANYAAKDEVVTYLEQVNAKGKAIEYCLFQPGLFMNYLSFPLSSCEFMALSGREVDFGNHRAILLEEGDQPFGTTTVQDLGRIVTAALDYEGEWPKIGGIRGGRTSWKELVASGEQLSGRPFKIEKITRQELAEDKVKTSWTPQLAHPAVPVDARPKLSSALLVRMLASYDSGVWDVSNEWNRLLPKMTLTTVEEFVKSYWENTAQQK